MLFPTLRYGRVLLHPAPRGTVSMHHIHLHTARLHVDKKRVCFLKDRIKTQLLLARFESTTISAPSTAATTTLNEVSDAAASVSNASSIDPELITEVAVQLNKLGEPCITTLGLGKWYTPPGLVERLVEYIHVTLDVPWWASICIMVVVTRVLLFPLLIKSQRNSIQMANVMPRLKELQDEVTQARTSGNQIEMFKATQRLSAYVHANNVNPLKSMMLSGFQAPVFVSYFVALRSMANAPVESMARGGALWFTDLTVPDQFMLLPGITCTTLWLTLEVSTSGGKSIMASGGPLSSYIKYGIKLLPVIIFPFIMNFPAAVLVYWGTNNFVSFVQVSVLRIPAVRRYLDIGEKKTFEIANTPKEKKGFFKDMKQSYRNMKLTKEVEERERLDQIAFQRAGRSPPVKTYKHDPTATPEKAEAQKN